MAIISLSTSPDSKSLARRFPPAAASNTSGSSCWSRPNGFAPPPGPDQRSASDGPGSLSVVPRRMIDAMRKPKEEAELFKAALQAGIRYAEGRGAVQFEATDSASDKALYIYRLLGRAHF